MKNFILFIVCLFQANFILSQISPSVGISTISALPGTGAFYGSVDIDYNKIKGFTPTLGLSFGGEKKGLTLSYFFSQTNHNSGIIYNKGNEIEDVEKFRLTSHTIAIKDFLGNKTYGIDRYFFSIDYVFGIVDGKILDYGRFNNDGKNDGFFKNFADETFFSVGLSFYKKIIRPNIYLYTSVFPTFYSSGGASFRVGYSFGLIAPFNF